MNHLMVCRICLAYDIRLHSISGWQLRDIYEKFTETSLESGDTKATCVCYVCFSLLKKFHKFIEKSKKSNQLLEQIINSGLELSENSLKLFCKQQTGIHWTLGKTPTFRVIISATEEEVNVETPMKIEYVNCEMNWDQNDDDDIPLEVTNQDSSSESEDNMPLQKFSKQFKADRSNVSEIKTSEILKPDAQEIIKCKEEQLQKMLEPFKCDLCYKKFANTKAFENHREKHDAGLHLLKKRKSNYGTEKERLKSQTFFEIIDKGEKNKAQNEDNSKILDFKIRSKKFKTIIPDNETTASKINSDIKNSEVEPNSNEQVTAQKNIFICDVCKKEYLCKSLLENHIKKWHAIEIDSKPNLLTDSNTKYQKCKKSNLLKEKYVQKNYIVAENKLSKKNKNKNKVSICSAKRQYKCIYCSRSFNRRANLERHVKIHTGERPYKCSICTKCFITSYHLVTHERTHTGNKPYKCSYCMKCFNQRVHMLTHERTHTGEKPFKCSYCMKCFSDSSSLRKHEWIHTGEQPYKCSYCTKCFIRRADLDSHHVRIHTGDKPYKCSYCTKCFIRRADLDSHHVRIHTGDKPYKCSYCTKCFISTGELARHVRIHTGEISYKCSYCMKCFSHSSGLRKHERIHTGEKPYKCSYCMKCFTTRDYLARHVRIHTGEKPYECSYCAKCFSLRGNLTTHLRIHTGEKRYKCIYCIKGFTKNSALAKHVNKIHKEINIIP